MPAVTSAGAFDRSPAVMRRAALALLAVLACAGCTSPPTDLGTRAQPTPIGVPAQVGSFEVTVGPSVVDGAEVEGRRQVLVPLRLTYDGASSINPWSALSLRFIARDGGVYGAYEPDWCGVIPGSVADFGDIEPGSTRLGTMCVAVPTDKVAGGSWLMSDTPTWGWHGFFEFGDRTPRVPGSRADPTGVGRAASVGAYTVAFGPTVLDAGRTVAAYDRGNAGPAPGRRYVLAPVTVAFQGGDSGAVPREALEVTFVGADGTPYGTEPDDSCGDIPRALEAVGPLAPSGSTTANVCVSVPTGQISGGTWHVARENSAFEWLGHFALRG